MDLVDLITLKNFFIELHGDPNSISGTVYLLLAVSADYSTHTLTGESEYNMPYLQLNHNPAKPPTTDSPHQSEIYEERPLQIMTLAHNIATPNARMDQISIQMLTMAHNFNVEMFVEGSIRQINRELTLQLILLMYPTLSTSTRQCALNPLTLYACSTHVCTSPSPSLYILARARATTHVPHPSLYILARAWAATHVPHPSLYILARARATTHVLTTSPCA